MQPQRYGLIGERLGHSFSKQIHEQLADYTYDLIELPPDQLAPFFTARISNGPCFLLIYHTSNSNANFFYWMGHRKSAPALEILSEP